MDGVSGSRFAEGPARAHGGRDAAITVFCASAALVMPKAATGLSITAGNVQPLVLVVILRANPFLLRHDFFLKQSGKLKP